MLEKTISEIISRYPKEVWPDLNWVFVERERRLPDGNIFDLRFRDFSGIEWIVELKRGQATTSAVEQVVRYVDIMRQLEPNTLFKGMIAAPSISRAAKAEAERCNVSVQFVDDRRLREVADAHGLGLDHASGHRPNIKRHQSTTSRPKARSGNRAATPSEVAAFLQRIDGIFPPGSLNNSTSIETITNYWELATPDAPAALRSIAARLTFEALQALPHAAVSTRSMGKTDPYTTIRGLDGRVAVAIDARKMYAKLDFPLPTETGQKLEDTLKLKIWKPRGYSVWCQARVGDGMPLNIEAAIELLRVGLAFEFPKQ